MDIYKIGNSYYFICSDKDVFLLNENDEYSRKLSADEIDSLDFTILWLGKTVKTKFESNDKKAALALTEIVDNFSKMLKNEQFHGFPLASIVSHLRAFLYEHILAEQNCFHTTITLSGEQRGTGKKLISPGTRVGPGCCNQISNI